MSDSKIGAKVRAMLDLADSEEALGHLDTAANHRATAQKWMVKYRIEQEEAIAVDPGSAKPIQVDIDLVGRGSKYTNSYHSLWFSIARHCEVRSWEEWSYTDAGYVIRAHVVGYEEDVRYAEMLYTSARLVFQEKLEPRVDPNLSDQVNAYRLRSAGLERIRIAELMWGNTDKVFMGRVGRLYKAECDERGEVAMLSGRGVTGKAFRDEYAEQFVSTFANRLWAARQAATATGGGLALHGRKERIDEAFYAFYPDQKPRPALPYEAPAPCEKCAKSKRGQCREHYIPMGQGSAGPDYNSVAAERGRMAGRAAAREVGLNRNGGRGELGS